MFHVYNPEPSFYNRWLAPITDPAKKASSQNSSTPKPGSNPTAATQVGTCSFLWLCMGRNIIAKYQWASFNNFLLNGALAKLTHMSKGKKLPRFSSKPGQSKSTEPSQSHLRLHRRRRLPTRQRDLRRGRQQVRSGAQVRLEQLPGRESWRQRKNFERSADEKKHSMFNVVKLFRKEIPKTGLICKQ